MYLMPWLSHFTRVCNDDVVFQTLPTSAPPPRQEPWIAATTGFGLSSIRWIIAWPLLEMSTNWGNDQQNSVLYSTIKIKFYNISGVTRKKLKSSNMFKYQSIFVVSKTTSNTTRHIKSGTMALYNSLVTFLNIQHIFVHQRQLTLAKSI